MEQRPYSRQGSADPALFQRPPSDGRMPYHGGIHHAQLPASTTKSSNSFHHPTPTAFNSQHMQMHSHVRPNIGMCFTQRLITCSAFATYNTKCVPHLLTYMYSRIYYFALYVRMAPATCLSYLLLLVYKVCALHFMCCCLALQLGYLNR